MNIYVIYKFDDYDMVKGTLDAMKKSVPNASFFLFSPQRAPRLWHRYAKKKMRDSQLVIFFDTLSASDTTVGKHIRWELAKADRMNKRIVIFKKDPASQDRTLYTPDYSEQDPLHSRYKTVAFENAVDFIAEECGWSMNDSLLHRAAAGDAFTDTEKQLLLEQYRIMIETSEKLMERRQETVNLYTTLCTTLIAFIGASFAFGSLLICAIITWLSGLIITILCYNWRISLQSYDLNNTGKFEVINALEKCLPAEIFECEYRYNKLNGIRSFSSREKILPSIFTFFGIVLMLAATVLFIID